MKENSKAGPTEFIHITVPSQNLEKAIAFYTSLDMDLIEHEPLHHAHFENKEHQVIFTVYYNKQRPNYEVNVYFEVRSLEEYEVRLCKSILKPLSSKDWNGKELHLSDPDGNHVILYEKGTQESIPPWQQQTDES